MFEPLRPEGREFRLLRLCCDSAPESPYELDMLDWDDIIDWCKDWNLGGSEHIETESALHNDRGILHEKTDTVLDLREYNQHDSISPVSRTGLSRVFSVPEYHTMSWIRGLETCSKGDSIRLEDLHLRGLGERDGGTRHNKWCPAFARPDNLTPHFRTERRSHETLTLNEIFRMICSHDSHPVWIDAICIDQTDCDPSEPGEYPRKTPVQHGMDVWSLGRMWSEVTAWVIEGWESLKWHRTGGSPDYDGPPPVSERQHRIPVKLLLRQHKISDLNLCPRQSLLVAPSDCSICWWRRHRCTRQLAKALVLLLAPIAIVILGLYGVERGLKPPLGDALNRIWIWKQDYLHNSWLTDSVSHWTSKIPPLLFFASSIILTWLLSWYYEVNGSHRYQRDILFFGLLVWPVVAIMLGAGMLASVLFILPWTIYGAFALSEAVHCFTHSDRVLLFLVGVPGNVVPTMNSPPPDPDCDTGEAKSDVYYAGHDDCKSVK